MTKAKPAPMTNAERQAAFRARRVAAGGAQVTVTLNKQAMRALAKLTRDGTTQADALNALLVAATKR